jgi:hypothetical protein
MLFKNRVITVEWLLPYRDLWSSWGEGCAMLRYLDILNSLNFRGVDTVRYQERHRHEYLALSRFDHLRIVLSAD